MNFFLIVENRKVEVVKKLLIIVISVLISIIFVSTGLAFSKPPPERSTKEQMVPEKTPVPDAAPAAEKVLAPKKRTERAKIAGFVGIVAIVDSNLIQVKSKMEEVTFDASNPELKGYNALSDVMVGDTVTVAYTKDGIMITRLKGAVKTKTSEEKKSEKESKSSRKTVITRITCTGKGPCAVSVDKPED